MRRFRCVVARPRVVLGCAVAAAVASVGLPLAWAAIPGSDGTISGCYGRVGGYLRVIDAAAGGKCTAAESPIRWSQSGPVGPPGPQGPTGAAGSSDANTLDGIDSTGFVQGSGRIIFARGTSADPSQIVSLPIPGLAEVQARCLPSRPTVELSVWNRAGQPVDVVSSIQGYSDSGVNNAHIPAGDNMAYVPADQFRQHAVFDIVSGGYGSTGKQASVDVAAFVDQSSSPPVCRVQAEALVSSP